MGGIQTKSLHSLIFVSLCVVTLFAQNPTEEKPSVLFNGKFSHNYSRADLPGQRISKDGNYSCQFTIKSAGDEVRELTNLTFRKNGNQLFNLKDVPGSDIDISNAGFILFYDTRLHYKGALTLHFYNPTGSKLFSKTYHSANLFGFSSSGNKFGVGTPKGFEVINIPTSASTEYPNTRRFDIADDETIIAFAGERKVSVYEHDKLIGAIDHQVQYVRKIKLSRNKKMVALIGKYELLVYSLPSLKLVFSDALSGNHTFTDVDFRNNALWAGVHHRDRDNNQSEGILRSYLLDGQLLRNEIKTIKKYAPKRRLNYNYKKVNEYGVHDTPWPFKPFDEPNKAWNSYLLLSASSNGNNSGAYLHQGLDMDVPSYAETHATQEGWVKAVLTTGGNLYWRSAIADENTSSTMQGWLHAHLVESSIAVDVGDHLQQGDFIGTIIPWSGLPGGHIHFSRVESSGNTWGSWRNYSNPMFYLRPHGDETAPEIINLSNDSKFRFESNSSAQSLDADDLSGEIDILVKVRDVCGESPWTQAATTIWYWVKDLHYDKICYPRTLSFWRGRDMPDYSGNLYYSLPTVIWRVNSQFPVKGWFTKERLYVHIITNTNGDSIVETSDKALGFDTGEYGDGDYRIFVEVADAAGNTTIDSQDVVFNNGVTKTLDLNEQPVTDFLFNGIYSDKVDGSYKINFQIPKPSSISLSILDAQGNTLRTIDAGTVQYGKHCIIWNGLNDAGVKINSGIYFAALKAGDYSSVKKMVNCK